MRNVTLLQKALFCKSDAEFSEVCLPHTWNALDGQDGGGDYWRGTGYYKIGLPAPTPGKRQYIQFDGANHIAEVSCNGIVLGTHKGGFSTFRYELTDVLKDSGNVLEIAVSNPECDVYPQCAPPGWREYCHCQVRRDCSEYHYPQCDSRSRPRLHPAPGAR